MRSHRVLPEGGWLPAVGLRRSTSQLHFAKAPTTACFTSGGLRAGVPWAGAFESASVHFGERVYIRGWAHGAMARRAGGGERAHL
jgi:hypothetical protein